MINLSAIYIITILVYIIAYVLAIEIAPKISLCDSEMCTKFNKTHKSCIIENSTIARISTVGRGNKYFIGEGDNPTTLNNCVLTFWGSTHFLLYFVLGIIAPNLFWETFAVGVGFEIYEYYKFKCHDVFDIILNSSGFLIGKYIALNILH